MVDAATGTMGFTEVVYKIRSDHDPLCAATEANPELKVVVNQIAWDDDTSQGKTIITLLGADDKLAGLAQALVPVHDKVETLSQGKEQLVLRASARLDTMKKAGNPAAFGLDYFGEDAISQPSLVKDGYLHMRLLVTKKVDLADLLSHYEKGVKEGRWSDFKLIRIDDYDPETQIAGAFTESLTQKQLEVIKTALALGFYNTPRDITLDDLANIFGISKAAVHNRLQAAERKVIAKFFG
ncbi:MAG: HTH-type transcriptional regulator, dimethyl sulfoxide reductase transcription regulator [Thermoplasmata archaeon]|jgi:predicted DNA binding protein|nr:HTH-type transcriptional regulator, dimethyl sulfoxide reductase transcription regulator [Thermoplasmata archaeon]